MIRFKRGVKLRGMSPQIGIAINVADGVYGDLGYETVVTSVCDGKHSPGSLHYVGLAADFRTRHLNHADLHHIKAHGKLRSRLGVEFDVVLERDHIHVEWQPKRG